METAPKVIHTAEADRSSAVRIIFGETSGKAMTCLEHDSERDRGRTLRSPDHLRRVPRMSVPAAAWETSWSKDPPTDIAECVLEQHVRRRFPLKWVTSIRRRQKRIGVTGRNGSTVPPEDDRIARVLRDP